MNGSVAEEGGKVANSLITNLKDQPITLALVVFNLVFIAVVYFAGLDSRDHQEKLNGQLIEQINRNQTLISQCMGVRVPIPPAQPQQ